MKKKQVIALLCALTMTVGLVPVSASASNSTVKQKEQTTVTTLAEEMQVVDTKISFDKPAGLDKMTNLAKGKDVASDPQCVSNHPASDATDGERNYNANENGGSFAQLPNASGEWNLTVDLGNVMKFNTVVLGKCILDGNVVKNNLTRYQIQISEDGNTWKQLGTAEVESEESGKDVYFTPTTAQSARYVRVYSDDVGSGWKVVDEVEVYAEVDDTTVSKKLPDGFPKLDKLTNHALGAEVTSNLETFNNGYADGDHRPQYLTDGNLQSFAQVNGNVVQGTNDWELVVDLKEEKDVDLIAFRKLNLGYGNNNNVTNYKIELSQDGETWSSLGDEVQEAEPTYDDMYFAPSTTRQARYIKLTIPQASNWAVAAELEVYTKEDVEVSEDIDYSKYKNLALGGKVTLTEPEYNGHPGAHAVDGNIASYAQANNGQSFDMQIKLKKKSTVNTAILKWYGFGGNNLESRIKKFRIMTSEDGENWTEAGTHEIAKADLRKDAVLTFDPVEAEYVKFEMLKADEWMSVNELELYDTTKLPEVGTNVANGSTVKKGTKIELNAPFNADIYYTLDGSDPVTSGTAIKYENPIVVDGDMTIKTCAKKDGYKDSNVVTLNYLMQYVDASPAPGIVDKGTGVTLINHLKDAKVFYTTDGTDPKTSDTKKEYKDTDKIVIDGFTQIAAYSKSAAKETPTYTFTYANENAVAGKTVEAKSEKEGYEAEKAIDGDESTIWKPVNDASGEWISMDFEVPHDFEGINILWEDENADYQYVVETSWDKYMWYPYVSNPAGNNPAQKHDLQKSETHRQYMRIKLLGAKDGANYGIREIEVIGGESAEVPEVPMYDNPETDIYDRVVVNPMPDKVDGVKNPKISLNGKWNFAMTPQNAFWKNDADLSKWGTAKIPGDLDAEGYPVYSPDPTDTEWKGNFGNARFLPDRCDEMAYKREVYVPEDFEGKKVFLRIDKAYSYSRVWVNGQYVRDHRGAFNAWDADITDYIKPGQKNWITISVTAEGGEGFRVAELYTSRGIMNDVTMYAAPKSHLNRLHVETDLDSEYKDAELTVMTNAFLEEGKTADVKLSLKDMNGKAVALETDTINIDENFKDTNVSMKIKNPAKWDSEHPNLYTLTADMVVDGNVVETLERKIGFREISTSDNVFKVNGIATKLRGVDYLTVYGNDANAYDYEIEEKLMENLKQLNVNYIRAAHYPISDKTLNLCDELGIYVEQENSVHFGDGTIATHEFYREYLLNNVSEMVEKDRSHPAIVMWSVANETQWGPNHDATSKYIKAVNPTIPTKFSWGHLVPRDAEIDIHSNHYKIDGVGGNNDRPTVWDEYAHSWSNGDEAAIRFDSGFRDNYYRVIRENWEQIYENERNLGGAIWCYIDNAYEGKNQVMGNTYWGQIDAWGRLKPEGWATKNVYSPAQYKGEEFVAMPGKTRDLVLPYENRYETVNFDDADFEIKYAVNDGEFKTITSDIAAKQTGEIAVPAPKEGWKPGDEVKLEFFKTTNGKKRNVVTTLVTIGQPTYTFDEATGTAPAITEDDNAILVAGENFSLNFSKEDGLITEGVFKGKTVITGGPFLNLGMNALGAWIFNNITAEEKDGAAVVTIDGAYGEMGCTFTMNIDSEGRIETTYAMENDSAISTYEVGIGFDVTADVDKLSWVRDNYMNYYPEDQLGRLVGTAVKEPETERQWGVEPSWAWKDDDKDFYNFGFDDKGGRGTTDFNASKTGYYYAELGLKDSEAVLSAFGDGKGSVHAKINEDKTIRFNVNNAWGFPTDGLSAIGNHPTSVKPNYENTVTVKLSDVKDNYEKTYEKIPTSEFIKVTSATASSAWNGLDVANIINNAGMSDDKKLDAVHDNNGGSATSWHTANGQLDKAWVQVDLGKVHMLDEMWIWNHNQANLSNRGFKNVKIEYSTDGKTWTALQVPEGMTFENGDAEYPFQFAQASGNADQKATNLNDGSNTPVTFNGAKARYVKITANPEAGNGNWGDTGVSGLSELRFTERADKEALSALIGYAQSQQETEEYKYLVPIVKEKFEAALAEAVAVNDNAKATQEEVDAAYDKLLYMVGYLDFTGNSESLKVLVDAAKELNEKLYTEDSWEALQDALAKAEEVLANENSLQEAIDAARDALQNAMDGLAKIPVDKEALKKLVSDSKKYEDAIAEYTPATAEIFTGALAHARDVLANEDATQEQVDAAYAALQNAIFGLRLIPNKDKLDELIKNAEKEDTSKYTEESVKVFEDALAYAKAVFADENATEEDVKAAEDKLAKAQKDLVAKADTSKPDDTDKPDDADKTDDADKAAQTGDTASALPLFVMTMMAGAIVITIRRRREI